MNIKLEPYLRFLETMSLEAESLAIYGPAAALCAHGGEVALFERIKAHYVNQEAQAQEEIVQAILEAQQQLEQDSPLGAIWFLQQIHLMIGLYYGEDRPRLVKDAFWEAEDRAGYFVGSTVDIAEVQRLVEDYQLKPEELILPLAAPFCPRRDEGEPRVLEAKMVKNLELVPPPLAAAAKSSGPSEFLKGRGLEVIQLESEVGTFTLTLTAPDENWCVEADVRSTGSLGVRALKLWGCRSLSLPLKSNSRGTVRSFLLQLPPDEINYWTQRRNDRPLLLLEDGSLIKLKDT